MKRRLIALFTLLFLTVSLFADRYVVNTGHYAPVRRMLLMLDDKALVTTGDDGTIRIFQPRTGAVMQTIQASPFAVTEMVAHPSLPRVAILEDDGVAIYRLSVWDIEANEKLFSVSLSKHPLQIAFSPKGTYLVYSLPDFDSLVVLDAETGNEVRNPDSSSNPLFPGFGIVNSFVIGNSERNIAAYLPSGSLQYREMKSGTRIQRFETVENLVDVHFVPPDGAFYAVGRSEDFIIAIDILSGEDVSNRRVDNILDMVIDTGRQEVLVLHETRPGIRELSLFAFRNERLSESYLRYGYSLPEAAEVVSLYFKNRTVYYGCADGRIFRQTSTMQAPEEFSRNIISGIDTILPGESTLITADDEIVTVNFDILSDGTPVILTYSRPNVLRERLRAEFEATLGPETAMAEVTVENQEPDTVLPEGDDPTEETEDTDDSVSEVSESESLQLISMPQREPTLFIERVGMLRLAADLYLLYDLGGNTGRFAYFNPVTGELEQLASFVEPPIRSLDISGFDILTVDNDGYLAITNLFTEAELFNFPRTGLRTAIFTDPPYIAAAGRRAGVPSTTTLLINTETSETIPLDNDRSLTFALAFDAIEGALYSANINRTAVPAKTEIVKHYGPELENSYTVFSIDGEFFDATVSAQYGVVFASVGGVNLVKRERSKAFTRIENPASIPRSVHVYDDWLFSVNRDSTITVWSVDTGSIAATFYLFEENGWAIIGADGSLIDSTEEAKKLLTKYR